MPFSVVGSCGSKSGPAMVKDREGAGYTASAARKQNKMDAGAQLALPVFPFYSVRDLSPCMELPTYGLGPPSLFN